MKFVLYTNTYSPHEMPLFLACADVFDEAVYVVEKDWEGDASRKGWQPDLQGRKTIVLERLGKGERMQAMTALLTSQTVVMYGRRGNPYEEAIQSSSAIVIYVSERWMKPSRCLPGVSHVLQPSFVKSVLRLRKWLQANPRSFYFGQGIYAVRDMALLTGMGRISCFENVPAGEVRVGDKSLSQIRLWGYFVEHSNLPPLPPQTSTSTHALRVLWVGRMLKLKHVDTIIRAVAQANKDLAKIRCSPSPSTFTSLTLTLVGSGPEESRLKKLASALQLQLETTTKSANSIVDLHLLSRPNTLFTFHDFVPISEVRQLMREHDVYVLSSDRHEGWGAVVNEALDEGMSVLCSRETGSGATMLPDECLFSAGNYRELAEKLRTIRVRPGIGTWTPQEAAKRLYDFAKGVQ